jgi:hypothetical protein
MGELTLPVYLKILEGAGALIMVSLRGQAFYVRALDSRFIEAFPGWSRMV